MAVVLLWLRSNWLGAGSCLAVGLILGLLGGKAEASKMTAVAAAGATQTVTGTAQAHSGAVIELPGRPEMPCPESKVCPPCPPVRIVYDCSSGVAGGVSQSSSATAAVMVSGPSLGIWGGGGVTLSDFSQFSGVYGELALSYGSFMIPVRLDSHLTTSVGVAYRFR